MRGMSLFYIIGHETALRRQGKYPERGAVVGFFFFFFRFLKKNDVLIFQLRVCAGATNLGLQSQI